GPDLKESTKMKCASETRISKVDNRPFKIILKAANMVIQVE
ncbi:36127_t:CDS:1, partial [Gigaspora margarita]